MRVIIGSHDPLTRPGHIHNLGQGSYAHHARFQFFTDARCLGTANTSAGHREYVSVRIRVGFAGGRIEREIRPLNKVATPPAFNLLRLLAGWSSTPLVQFLQEGSLMEHFIDSEPYEAPASISRRVGCMIGAALCGISAMIMLALFAWLFLWATEARAHDAIPTAAMPQGWTYPFSCCSGYDCREIDQSRVKETRSGYQMPTGEVIPYSGDVRLKDSPDGQMHWCTVAGADDSRTICLFAPPKSF